VDPSKQWPYAARIVWLTGGIVAHNNPGAEVDVCVGSNGPVLSRFSISSYGALFEFLKKQGYLIVGATFFVHTDEVAGLRPPEFRMAGFRSGWPLWSLRQQWRQIAFAAGKRNEMLLMNLASRISFGLEYGQIRLYDLVAAYAAQLGARSHGSTPSHYERFKDLNSREVYKAIHALFWELAVLRDALAEFAAAFCLSRPRVKTVAELLRSLRTQASTDPIAQEIESMADRSRGGWLSRFTSYRNFFTHVSPMEWASGVAFTVQDSRRINDQLTVPQIYYPLPRDIEGLTDERSRGVFFSTMAALAQASARQPDRLFDPDALEYLHICLNHFVDFAAKLLLRSPLAPTPIRFTEEDLVGEIKWSPGG
jgi:hypothetical protein